MVIMVVAALLLCAAALWMLRAKKHAQQELVTRMRASERYARLYPLLVRARTLCVESVSVHAEGVAVRLYRPAGRTLRHTFERQGSDELDQTLLYALAQAVAIDLPILLDSACFTFHAHRETLPNGESRLWYEYMIRPDYREHLLRAEYMA